MIWNSSRIKGNSSLIVGGADTVESDTEVSDEPVSYVDAVQAPCRTRDT